MTTDGVDEAAPRRASGRRALEILLVAGSFLAASVVGGLAAAGDRPGAAKRASLAPRTMDPASPLPTGEGPPILDDPLHLCVQAAGYAVEDITDVHPDPIRSLRLTRGAEVAFVFVFHSAGAATSFMEVYGPDTALVRNLGTVILEFGAPPGAETESVLEGCAALA